MRPLTALFLLLATSSVCLAQTAAPLPITHVTLYTSGVGYFERTGSVSDDSQTVLDFPVEQVNDVLKSLVLLDYGGGTIEPVTYGAQDSVNKQLKAFSVDLSDDPSEAQLLDRIRGASVTVTYAAPSTTPPVNGFIIGVETNTTSLPNDQTVQSSTLNLLSGLSIVAVPLNSIASVAIDDPALKQELQEALATVAQGRDASKRPVTIDFSGKGTRRVLIGYLTQTPLWQTSYRLVLGDKPFVEGWALVQNTSSEDWTNVGLSLVAGQPISFIQDLYSPVYINRPVVQPEISGSPTPQLYSSNLDIDNKYANAQQSSEGVGSSATADSVMAPPPAPMAVPMAAMPEFRLGGVLGRAGRADVTFSPADISAATTANGAKLGTSLFSYTIGVPVTIARQKSAMIPFIDTDIQADRVSIYNSTVQADHPLTGARLKNTTGIHLMGGPLTVFDSSSAGGSSYVGDALIDDTEPGQTRLISFAVDLAVDAASQPGPSTGQTIHVIINKGVLQWSSVLDTETDYTFKNNSDKDRIIVVEHPYQGSDWKLLQPAVYDERTADIYRFNVPVASHASKVFVIKEEQTQWQSQQITDMDLPTIVGFFKNTGLSQQESDALHQVVDLRNAVSKTQNQVSENEAEQSTISSGQERIRQNMQVLDKTNALYNRYTSEMDAQETKLNALLAQHDTLEQQLSDEQNKLSDYVSTLTVN